MPLKKSKIITIKIGSSLLVDKNKKVRRIHTGFNGPATGNKYEEFMKDFEQLIVSLSVN